MRTKQGAIGKDFGKVIMLHPKERNTIRFRLADYKKNLLENYNNTVILLNGDLERLIAEGKEKELASGLIASVQALINDVDFIYWLVNGKRYFVTDEPGDSFENALDNAVREHCEGVRNDNTTKEP